MAIIPCLWFDNEAEEAVNFYVSIFPISKIKHIERYAVKTPSNKPVGSVMTVTFDIYGMEYMALNGGPQFRFNESISLIIPCESQKEIDKFYDLLSDDSKAEMCGWLKDKYGLSWQLIPKNILTYTQSDDPGKKERVMKALLKMKRINLSELEKA